MSRPNSAFQPPHCPQAFGQRQDLGPLRARRLVLVDRDRRVRVARPAAQRLVRPAFDPRASHAHAVASLPLYAVPVFVRAQREAEVTGTFKLRKVELTREGYDPARASDPLFVRDESYVPLDAARHRAVCEGRLRF